MQHLGCSAEERGSRQDTNRNKAPSRREILSQNFTKHLLHLALGLWLLKQ